MSSNEPRPTPAYPFCAAVVTSTGEDGAPTNSGAESDEVRKEAVDGVDAVGGVKEKVMEGWRLEAESRSTGVSEV